MKSHRHVAWSTIRPARTMPKPPPTPKTAESQDRERDVVGLPPLRHHRERIRMTRLYTDDAELYDILFDWDVEEEVDWLFERLGRPASVLEPGCGSGRMLESFARRGVEAV